MHTIEPHYGWLKYYNVAEDENSPYDGKSYNFDLYSETIYGYYIDPHWDFMGSETLYIKVLYADYDLGFIIIEFIGEWNDALNNDIMHLKRNIVDHFNLLGINKYILIGENVLNFHGSDDSYYEEWFDDVEEGWICGINFRDFVTDEMKVFNVDSYLNFGGDLDIENWRTLKPQTLFEKIDLIIGRRIGLT
ncbi:hypothetical protein [uncultured Roseivirga sp.]|uniref:hypothetical protein n=1 Tax=uncultured Roseivirga sp. TaxID=543088 RepID=UPI0030DB3C1C|tara:strand:+ start:93571 stop:94143 length:573 start_codon:yes stop_codon:yes gene_type:complete